ncbi:MAG TPA: CBS domain-containing protein [Planctomycetaceae bacterium]|nr:CBS domain-containing protein [Planctomycetaceae bacterium]
MATVSDILKAKPQRDVLSAERSETVLAATQRMNDHSIGALIVTDGGRLCGIFTERDVLRRVVVEQRPPAETRVGDVMTSHVACCSLDTSIDEVRSIMMTHRIRHLPVVNNDGGLLGLVSIGDLNAHLANDREVTLHFLNEYLHGRV